MRAGVWAAWVLALAAAGFAHAAPPTPAASELAAPDPAVVRGVLPNGLRYAILPNTTPRQAVSIRLHIRAGSALETEAERGAAHFVEHMAFQGSKRFPGTSADARFAAAGISVGRDQNAFTDATGVLYVFDIPQVDPAKLDLAFDWMRDAMDALSFDPDATTHEREVVLQELAVRRNGATELGEQIARFATPGLPNLTRSPGGTTASVKALDATTLRAFHDRWYRPDRTTLVIAGDLGPESLRARLIKAFGDWRAATPAPAEPEAGSIEAGRALAAYAVNTPNFAQGLVQVCRVAPREPPMAPGVAAWRRDAATAIWLEALQLRLRRLQRQTDGPFVTGSASRSEPYRRARFTCVTAAPKAGRWNDALSALAIETRRLAVHGVTEAEAARAEADLRAAVQAAAGASSTRASSALAAGLLAAELDARIFSTPAETARTYALAEPSLSAAAASEAFRNVWTAPGGPQLVVLSTTPVAVVDVRTAWAGAQIGPEPAPPKDEAAVVWPYTGFGPAGRVVKREEVADPDFTRLLFSNGLKVNFKRTAFSRDQVFVRIAFGAGQEELRPDQQIAAQAAVLTLAEGALGRLDSDALGRALQGRIWGASLSVERTTFGLSGATTPADLSTELQLLAAVLTDPGFRPEAELRIPTLAEEYDKTNRVEPLRAAQIALNAALPRPHVFDPPTKAEFSALKVADLARAVRPALTGAALEVTVVGDVDEAVAVEALSRTLGAIARRSEASRARPDAERGRFPPAAPPVIRTTHLGLKDKAVVYMVWPLYVWEPARQREARALTLLREVMGEALRKEIRERMGLTYTPSMSLGLDRGGDQGSLAAIVQTSPELVDRTVDALRAVASRLAREGVTPAELERVRKPLLDETARRKETNGWWINVLDGSWAFPYKLEQQRTWLNDYTTLPASEVGAAAAKWLASAPVVAVATPDPSAPGGPPGLVARPLAAPAPPAPSPPTAAPTTPAVTPIPGAHP